MMINSTNKWVHISADVLAVASLKKNKLKISAEVKNGKGFIRLVDYIEEFSAASASNFRQEVDRLLSQGVTECDVYVNSKGGDVFEATEIANELKRFQSVKIFVGAVAASAATYICSKFHTTLKPNSQYMVHRPSMFVYGNYDEILSSLKGLQNVEEDYKITYAEKTGKTPEQIVDLWLKGDVWMTAKEALDSGFVDAVETEEAEITEDDVALLTACAAPNIPEINSKHKNSNQMDKLKLRAMLGLSAEATDEEVEAAIKANKQAADEAAAEEETEEENQAQLNAKLVDGAIAAKKITAKSREHYMKLAAADYDTTKQVLDGLKATPKLSASLETKAADDDGEAERKDWTLDDYLDKAPEVYAKMKTDNPEKAKRLEAAYFGAKKK